MTETAPNREITFRFAAAIWLVAAAALANYPDAPRPARPMPLPELPASFPLFTPPLSGSMPSDDAPALAEWTRSNGPGDTLALTGSRLSAFTGEEAGRDTRFVVFGQSAAGSVMADGDIQRISGQQAAITLPDNLPAATLYMVWPKNEHGFGAPALLNQTEAWWIGPEIATRGDRVSLFGRNLTAGDSGTNGWIYLQAEDNSGQWLTSTTANPYKADFTLPADTASGSYRVWAHNSLGGAYGWSGPLELTVVPRIIWSGPVLNVKHYGATGDGLTDDSDAIAATIYAARAIQNSTVYFPAGTYMTSRSVRSIPDHTRLRGDGIDQTVIAAHPSFATDEYGLLFGSMQEVLFSDMTFDGRGHVQGVLGGNIGYIRDSSRVEFNRVRFSQRDGGTWGYIFDTHRCDLITFRDCDFIVAEGMFLGKGRQIFIDGCDFRGVHNSNALIYEWGGREVSIINCTAADYDNSDISNSSGWCQGRFVAGHGMWGAMRHIYFGGNTTTDMTVHPDVDYQNTGEQFMMEGLDTQYRGAAISAGEDTVRLAGLDKDHTGDILVVVAGPGMGQSREITAHDTINSILTVNAPWTVTPTPTSVVMIGHYMSRMAVYDNTFDGKERAVTNTTHIASSGVQPYGGCVELEVAKNRFHQLRHAISNWTIGEQTTSSDLLVMQPNYFNIFMDNEFDHCLTGCGNLSVTWRDIPLQPDVRMLGIVFRRNLMNDILDAPFSSQNNATDAPVMMCVFDGNVANNVGMGMWGDTSGLRDHVLVRNHFSGRGGDALVLQPDHFPVLRENTWEGFTTGPSTGTPGAILELPQRTLTLTVDLGQTHQSAFNIWNSGTAPLTWQASTTSPWLQIENANGIVNDECYTGSLKLNTDTAGLEPGLYQAIVTIVSGGQSRQVTVKLNADLSSDAPPPLIAFDSPEAAGGSGGIAHWMTVHGIDTNSTANLDTDDDGLTLLEEYAFNMDPNVPSRQGAPRLQTGPVPGSATYLFNRARAELGYRVEQCTDLCTGNWVPVAVNPGNAGELISLAVTPAPGQTSGFFRLAISLP